MQSWKISWFTNFAAINNLTIIFDTVLAKIWFYYDSGKNIHDLLVYFQENWPKETIPPNLNMCKDHAADFIETWSSVHGVYREHGAESIHKIFMLLQRTYCTKQPATRHLQGMLKEHYRLVHPDTKALKPAILKRNQHPKGEIQCYHKNICLNLLYASNIRVLLRQYCFYTSNIQYTQETKNKKVPFWSGIFA